MRDDQIADLVKWCAFRGPTPDPPFIHHKEERFVRLGVETIGGRALVQWRRGDDTRVLEIKFADYWRDGAESVIDRISKKIADYEAGLYLVDSKQG